MSRFETKDIEKDKWAQTGWRIEQRYGNRALIGNWAEERRQFTREPKIADSISRVDYRPHWDFKPDVFERRSALLRAEGLPYRILFDHHSSLPSHYLAEDYEQRNAHKPSSSLPAIQLWNPNMTFQSERFDKPISVLSADTDPLKYTDDF
ncbi:uncharacterized protein C1orf158 homolog [Fundulus heteroclitus]|uniref:uncharacterized protein C1orf158 homolog n=1 Tax=Fundulus heteroclitus TaxID=8078 RepID=UPI00165BEB55|nr:uncharacterized protein C1orf158 homolog [Fundulus heteroclitus]